MAVYGTTKTQSYSTVVGQGMSRALMVDKVSVAIATAMIDNANDEIELLWVPKGAVVDSVELRCTDLDGATALVWDVGIDGTEALLIAAATTGQTATTTTTLAAAGFGYKFTAATKIKAFVNTASGTPATGTLYFTIRYFVDETFTLAASVVS